MKKAFQENPLAKPHIQVDPDLCNGCVLCMKACPNQAIRIRDGIATLEGTCIDCWECVRTCPVNAIRSSSSHEYDQDVKSSMVAIPSSVLYSQFGPDYLPNDILLGLSKMGFPYVYDQSYTCEMASLATELYIQENRRKESSQFPLISASCPVVLRLIAHRFPALLSHIPPLLTPREIVVQEAKARLSAQLGLPASEITILNVTPCPALAEFVKETTFQTYGHTDRAIGINSIHEQLARHIDNQDDDRVLHYSSGIGLGWGMSGGEISGLSMQNCLAISGLKDTIRYLEKIEMGLFNDVDFVEFRTCKEGCLGGPYTVADKYRAKHFVQKLVRMFGVEKRVKHRYVVDLYNKGWFFRKGGALFEPEVVSPDAISRNIERLNQANEILKRLPRRACGACGAPDCRAFSLDVVDGRAQLSDCAFLEGGGCP